MGAFDKTPRALRLPSFWWCLSIARMLSDVVWRNLVIVLYLRFLDAGVFCVIIILSWIVAASGAMSPTLPL